MSAFLAIAPVTAAGCRSEPEFVTVEGVVTLNGKPLPDVEVVFLPDPELGTVGPRAAGYTDGQGRYKLRCERPETDGTVVGTHRVCVYDITALPPPPDPDTDTGFGLPLGEPGRRSRVPPEYGDVSKTPLRNVPVDGGKQPLNFDLRSRPG